MPQSSIGCTISWGNRSGYSDGYRAGYGAYDNVGRDRDRDDRGGAGFGYGSNYAQRIGYQDGLRYGQHDRSVGKSFANR